MTAQRTLGGRGATVKLYRGASVPRSVQASNRASRGRSFAEHFMGTGLCSKFIDGGKSSLIVGKSLTAQVVAHVGYLPASSSSEFSYRSPMLSFSPDRDLAMVYAERDARKRALLTRCDYEQATHFRWQFLGVDNPTGLPGVHLFDYVEDFSNVRSIHHEMLVSLRPGTPAALRVKDNGTVVNGNHRIAVLRERQFDVEALPREQYVPEEIDP